MTLLKSARKRAAQDLRPRLGQLALVAAVVALTGCASLPEGHRPHPDDPFESYNRGMTEFNEHVDTMVLRPTATAYKQVLPAPVRTGVSNFFANLGDVWSVVNNALQLRLEGTMSSFMRVNVNTFMGLGGVLDVATELGIDRHKQDFGLTLGRWGVNTGPYVVLPILGPSTLRDTLALPVDLEGNPVRYVKPESDRNALYALNVVNTRANLLRASSVLDGAALDKYSFTRDVFMQVRQQAVQPLLKTPESDANSNDGVLPEEPEQ